MLFRYTYDDLAMDTQNGDVLSSRTKDLKVSEPVTEVPGQMAEGARIMTISKRPDWTVKELLAQPKYFQTITITTAQAFNAVLFDQTVDPTTIINSVYAAGTFSFSDLKYLYSFHRFRPILTFEVSSNFQQVGCFALAFIPFGTLMCRYNGNAAGTNTFASYFGYARMVQLPHQVISYGHSGTYEVQSDWILPEQFVQTITANSNMNPGAPQGHFLARVIAPLRVVTGSVGQISVRVWCRFEVDPEVYYPTTTIMGAGLVP